MTPRPLSDEAVRREALNRLHVSRERRDVPRLRRRLNALEWVGLAVVVAGVALAVWVVLLLLGVVDLPYSLDLPDA